MKKSCTGGLTSPWKPVDCSHDEDSLVSLDGLSVVSLGMESHL